MGVGPVFRAAMASCVLFAAVSPTAAGGKPVECYEPYRTAPVYDTVYENVMVSPGGQQVEYVPPIYGTRKRTVLVTPEQVSYETIPAVVQTQYRTVRVSDGGYSWEWRWINGRKVLCKIKHKPRYETIAENVVVQPEYRRRVIIPAEYGYEMQQVIVQQAQRRVIDVPATYQTVARQVLVSEGETGWRRVKIRRHCG